MKPDLQLWTEIRQSDQEAFRKLFDLYFTELVRFSAKLTANPYAAEEIVQDTFIYIWQKRKEIEIQYGLKSYLFSAVKNASLNYLKSRQTKQQSITDKQFPEDINPLEKDESEELKNVVANAIQNLPEACRNVFLLSRNFNFTNKEIAEELNISIKTVENQMTIALRKIREYLQKHWYIFLLLFEKIFKNI